MKSKLTRAIALGLIYIVSASIPLMGSAAESPEPLSMSPAPHLVHWRAADSAFTNWSLSNIELRPDGSAILAGHPGMGASDGVRSGELMSPVVATGTFREAIGSWNAETPVGTWLDIQIRARLDGRWSDWYYLGIWTSNEGDVVRRQSVAGQQDADFRVAVDTLVTRASVSPDAVQLLVRLLSNDPAKSPRLFGAAVALSDHPASPGATSAGDPALWGRALDVPACSQMVYPGGGEIWCSPTSTSMVLGYWEREQGGTIGSCASRVLPAVDGVYDFVYDGHGNWPFNVAYASTNGLEGYVTRLRSLEEAERWIARGIPLVISYGWAQGELDGAPLPWSQGHLAVLSGFDGQGNPIVHDPAGATDGEVVHVYRRDQLERLWLEHSAGTVYVIAPPDRFALRPRLWLPFLGQ